VYVVVLEEEEEEDDDTKKAPKGKERRPRGGLFAPLRKKGRL
jgi:hypothetical protein